MLFSFRNVKIFLISMEEASPCIYRDYALDPRDSKNKHLSLTMVENLREVCGGDSELGPEAVSPSQRDTVSVLSRPF